jgi:hypothetical protein
MHCKYVPMIISFINLKFYRSIKLEENFTHYHFLIIIIREPNLFNCFMITLISVSLLPNRNLTR